MQKFVLILFCFIFLSSCKENNSKNIQSDVLTFKIKNFDDSEYPDNPDIGFRSSTYQNELFASGKIDSKDKQYKMDFKFFTNESDTIKLENINVSELIPTIPDHIKSDDYLSYVSCINQEWNRNQVKFDAGQFKSTIPNVTRVDLARNCLNAYLWEVILYTEENKKTVPYAHGWFDFPQAEYARLFEKKNDIPFSKFQKPLENWVEPESKKVDFSNLRVIRDTIDIEFQDLSDAMYPIKGARKKKYKEIIYPDTFSTMRDLQSDSTLFATFSPPGIYNKNDPRKTELGRFYNLTNIELHTTDVPTSSDMLHEIELSFTHKSNQTSTKLVFGGLDFNEFPVFSEQEANKGWKNSMGIGNHPFYETYDQHIQYKSEKSPYYGLITDAKDNWLDSHKIGIDGQIFHFTNADKKHLHLWLLSFERHALVGHYLIKMK